MSFHLLWCGAHLQLMPWLSFLWEIRRTEQTAHNLGLGGFLEAPHVVALLVFQLPLDKKTDALQLAIKRRP